MKKLFKVLLFLLVGVCFALPGFTADLLEDEVYVWTFEYDDETITPDEEIAEIFTPVAIKEEILDEIFLDNKVKLKYKTNIVPTVKPFVYNLQKDTTASGLNVKRGDFLFSSSSQKAKNDYFTDSLHQRTEARFLKKSFEVATGFETKYDNADASTSSQKLYLAPKINLSDEVSFIFNNKVDPTSTTLEQEVGVSFKPKILPNSVFKLMGGATVQNGVEKSQKVRFNTDLFLW